MILPKMTLTMKLSILSLQSRIINLFIDESDITEPFVTTLVAMIHSLSICKMNLMGKDKVN